MSKLIYLAQPYSHADSFVRNMRFQVARHVAAALMGRYAVFSPIVHGVGVEAVLKPEDRSDHEFWMRQCYAHLRHAESMYVIPLIGWRESKGLTEELAFAKSAQIPIYFVANTIFASDSIWTQYDTPSQKERTRNDWGIDYV